MNDKLLLDVDTLDRYIKELSLEINFEEPSDGKNDSQRVVRLKDFEVSWIDLECGKFPTSFVLNISQQSFEHTQQT